MITTLTICLIAYCIIDLIQIKSNSKKQDAYVNAVEQLQKQNKVLIEDININKKIINILIGKEEPESDEKEA